MPSEDIVPAGMDPTAEEPLPPTGSSSPDSAIANAAFPVVGIGASAGGLDAFKKFFAAMPADSGIAFVLVPHLDPTHASLMVELLNRRTSMPVVEATEGVAVEANRVYIIPPNKNMTIAGGVLRLTGPVERSSWQTSIDLFLRSLAHDQLEKAICIILSGTGSHGTLGLKAVKAAGGLALVQDPKTASYPSMPESASATGLADQVLPVEQMPEALIKYVQHFHVNGGRVVAAVEETPDLLSQILALVRDWTQFDFSGYRKKTLARRMERRMGLCHFENVADYLAHLHDHPDEVKQLARDMLISVTRFFRDSEAFHTLQTEVHASLIRAKGANAPFRVWVPGCATGEEPYTIAMLLLEHLSLTQNPCRLQIFATDVDEQALGVARRGIYPADISADVSPERLSRFFTRVDKSAWQISKQVRETVTFAVQNLTADAPFSKMDLISCRNLLIYLEPEVQRTVLARLHFALKDRGCLFLGPSETIGQQTELFQPVSKTWRIYLRIGPSRAENWPFSVTQRDPRPAPPVPASRSQAPPKLAELAQNSLLRRFGLACVVIDNNHEVLHFAGPTEDYLIQPGGPPTQNLIALARHGLESKLRVVIHRATRDKAPHSINDVKLRYGDESRRVNIAAEPLHFSKQTEGLLLISFQEQSNSASETLAQAPAPADPANSAGETLTEAQTRADTAQTRSDTADARADTAESDLLRQLEQELEITRDDLHGTLEEWESANEELKASNEEVMSMNEELQSANEELETSKEELQSFNEELSTVNNQLHDKIEEVETATNDMANLLETTEIATVFLDPGLRIKLFTPASRRLFNLIASDRGRPIGDITNRFTDGELLPEAEQVLRDRTPREKEVRTDDGCWYVRHMVPYHTLDNRIDGVVVTFVDITERKLAADASVRRLAAVVESSADAMFSKDLDGTIQTWNRGAEQLYGYSRDEVVGRSVQMLVPADRTDEWTQVMAMLARGEHVAQLETERICKGGQRIAVALTVSPMRDSEGKVVSASVTARDVTDRKRALNELKESETRYRTLFNTMLEGFCIIEVVFDAHGRPVDYRFLEINPAFEKHSGLQDAQGRLMRDLVPDLEAHWFEIFGKIALTGEPARFVNEAKSLNRWYEVSAFRLGGEESRKVAVVFNDITEAKRAEETLRQSERRERERAAELAAILDAMPTPILIAHDPDCLHITGNRAADALLRNPPGAEASLTASAANRPQHYRAVKDGRDLRNEELPCQRAAQGSPVQDFEFSLLFDDGTTHEMLAYATPLTDEESQPRGAINVLVDITERKRAQEQLALQTRQQADIAALGEMALTGEPLQNLMDEAIRAVANTLGNELVKVLELLPGGDRLLLKAGVGWKDGLVGTATVSAGRKSQAGYTLLTQEPVVVADLAADTRFDGPALLTEHGVVSGISCAILGTGGVPYGVLGTHTRRRREFTPDDITYIEGIANVLGTVIQHRLLEESRRNSEARLAAILNTAADGVITIDSQGTIQSVNPAAERIFGYAASEMMGQNVKMLMPAPYRDEHDGYLARYLQTGEKHIIGSGREVAGRRKDGSTFPVDLAVSQVGYLNLFTGILRDISERKQLQADVLNIVTEEDIRIGQELHDSVQQQLTGLGLIAQNLADTLSSQDVPVEAGSGRPEWAKRAGRVAQGISKVLNEVHVLARGLIPVEVDSGGLVSALIELASTTSELTVPSLKQAGDSPRESTPIHCTFKSSEAIEVTDNNVATHLFRIAQEAVTNAVKHAQGDRIEITLERVNHRLCLQVLDNGTGIQDKYLRGEASGPDNQRSLGLRTMTYRAGLVGAMLRVERAPERGTRVTCMLPI